MFGEQKGEISISVIVPAKNEASSMNRLLTELNLALPDAEIVVVDDGFTDGTGEVARNFGVHVITNSYSKGNGAAIKTGARHATGDIFAFMDGDGQHRPEDISRLLAKLDEGYDMVVGARMSRKSQAGSIGRRQTASTIALPPG